MNHSPPCCAPPPQALPVCWPWKSVVLRGLWLLLLAAGVVPSALSQQTAPTILGQPQNTNVFLGSPASFTVQATGTPPLNYIWFGPGGVLPNETNGTLILPNVTFQDVGVYSVRVSNQFGAAQSSNAVLAVRIDFGDAPQPYPSFLSMDGARHVLSPGMHLGNGVTAEPDAQVDTTANGDPGDDGVLVVTPLVRGYPCKIRVVASKAGRLDGWMDFAANGDWSNAVDQIFANATLEPGTNILVFNVPSNATLNPTYARFRFSSEGNLRFGGLAMDGEVEDYMLRVLPAAADLCVASSVMPAGGAAGYSGRCFLSVTNLGPSTATGVWATNILTGADMIFDSGDGSCTVQGERVICNLGDLQSGEAKEFFVDYVRGQPGVLTNILQVRSDVADPFLQNNKAMMVIRAAEPLVITDPPRSVRVSPGSTVTFSVEAKGAGPLFYQWFLNGNAIAGAVAPFITLEDVQESGEIQVEVSDQFGSILSPVATLTVLRKPQVMAQPNPVSAPFGATVEFSVQAGGTPPLRYQWRLNGANIRGATNSSLLINSVSRGDGGSYSVAIANEAGVVSSARAPLILQDVPVYNGSDSLANRIPLPTTGNAAYQGFIQTDNLNASREPGEPDHALKAGSNSVWFKWTAPVSGIARFDTVGTTFDTLLAVYTGTNFASLKEVASDEDSGGYFRSVAQFNAEAGQSYAIAVDGFAGKYGNLVLGWSLEQTSQLLPVFIQHPRSIAALEGTPVTLFAQVSNATPNTTYQWVFNGRELPGGVGPDLIIPKLRPNDVGSYWVRVTDAAGRVVESRQAAVEIGPVPTAQSQDKVEDVLLNTSQTAGFRFAKSGGFPPFVSVALGVPGTQVMNNTNSTADIDCFEIGSATRWLGFTVTNLANVTNCVLRVTTSGSAIPTELAVYRYISLSCLQSVPCLNTNLMGCDTNSSGGGIYSLLQFTPVPNGQYLVFADGLGAAQGMIRINWQLGAAPVITSGQSNCSLVCTSGQNLVISCGVTNAIPTPSYQWYYNGDPISGANGSTLAFGSVQGSNAGPYSVIVSNAFGVVTNYCCLVVTPPTLAGKAVFTNGVPSTYSVSSALLPGYILQYTTNLSPPIVWQNVFTNTTTNCSFLHVSPMIGTNGQALPQRYYRAMSP